MYDWLIVGAGFSGAVLAERIATQLDQRVLLVDQRPHLAGNAYDHFDDAGVLVHKYGPHLFHTNSQRVWDYLSEFTDWRPYAHRVRAVVDGKQVPVPFNLTSLRMLLPRQADRLESLLKSQYGDGANIPVLKMRQEPNAELRELADYIYQNIFHGYTVKQWGLKPDELSPSVTGRIPIRISHDDRYFFDRHQTMPSAGYTEMFKRMLAHRNIDISLNTAYSDLHGSISFKRMIYTGPIDEYFHYLHGHLPYRSLTFEFETFPSEQILDVGQINYPNEHRYTRVTEFKHATGQKLPSTTISREFPQAHVPKVTEPFYPIPRDEHRLLFNEYQHEVKKLKGSVIFCGRLADYQYYNMDQVVARALMVFEQEIATDAASLRGAGDAQPRSAAA